MGIFGYNPTNFTGYIPINDSTICSGEGIYFTMLPNNNSSNYIWTLNTQNNWSTDQFTGVLFNQAGNYTMSVMESNYGCFGAGSDTAQINVIGTPVSTITGPSQVSTNDTLLYSAVYNALNTYNWNCNNALVINSDSNRFEIAFPSAGSYQVQCTVTNICTSNSSTKNVTSINGLSLNDKNEANDIQLLSNISDGSYQLKFHSIKKDNYILNLYDSNGREVYNNSINENETISNYYFKLDNIETGIYFLKISNKQQTKIFKIVKV